jgi:hypothetical protein
LYTRIFETKITEKPLFDPKGAAPSTVTGDTREQPYLENKVTIGS